MEPGEQRVSWHEIDGRAQSLRDVLSSRISSDDELLKRTNATLERSDSYENATYNLSKTLYDAGWKRA